MPTVPVDKEWLTSRDVMLERIERDLGNATTLLHQALTGGGENPRSACQLVLDILTSAAEKLRQAQAPF